MVMVWIPTFVKKDLLHLLESIGGVVSKAEPLDPTLKCTVKEPRELTIDCLAEGIIQQSKRQMEVIEQLCTCIGKYLQLDMEDIHNRIKLMLAGESVTVDNICQQIRHSHEQQCHVCMAQLLDWCDCWFRKPTMDEFNDCVKSMHQSVTDGDTVYMYNECCRRFGIALLNGM